MEMLKKSEPFAAWGGIIISVASAGYFYKEINELKTINNNIGSHVQGLMQKLGGMGFPEIDKLVILKQKFEEWTKKMEKKQKQVDKEIKVLRANQVKLVQILSVLIEEMGKGNKEINKLKKKLDQVDLKASGKKKKRRDDASDSSNDDSDSSDDDSDPLKKS